MESPDKKEEKYDLRGKRVKFFSAGKVIRLFAAIFISLFTAFGILAFVNLTLYPDLGIIDLAKERTQQWRSAKQSDMGHEAIAFELMLDAYAEDGGDISHAMDTLTEEFTAANWAELLEYDVDYFLKHEEIDQNTKVMGMLHITKTLYKTGHYDLFKDGYKVLMARFAEPKDYPIIYTELMTLEANFSYDDEEERDELDRLYELELRRHLKSTAGKIVGSMQNNEIEQAQLTQFVADLSSVFSDGQYLPSKTDKFRVQLGTDLSHLCTLIDQKAKDAKDDSLSKNVAQLRSTLAQQKLEMFDASGM